MTAGALIGGSAALSKTGLQVAMTAGALIGGTAALSKPAFKSP